MFESCRAHQEKTPETRGFRLFWESGERCRVDAYPTPKRPGSGRPRCNNLSALVADCALDDAWRDIVQFVDATGDVILASIAFETKRVSLLIRHAVAEDLALVHGRSDRGWTRLSDPSEVEEAFDDALAQARLVRVGDWHSTRSETRSPRMSTWRTGPDTATRPAACLTPA
jgi:hypothetical protein